MGLVNHNLVMCIVSFPDFHVGKKMVQEWDNMMCNHPSLYTCSSLMWVMTRLCQGLPHPTLSELYWARMRSDKIAYYCVHTKFELNRMHLYTARSPCVWAGNSRPPPSSSPHPSPACPGPERPLSPPHPPFAERTGTLYHMGETLMTIYYVHDHIL